MDMLKMLGEYSAKIAKDADWTVARLSGQCWDYKRGVHKRDEKGNLIPLSVLVGYSANRFDLRVGNMQPGTRVAITLTVPFGNLGEDLKKTVLANTKAHKSEAKSKGPTEELTLE